MEQKRISKLIGDYKNGNIDALEQLWKQMLPLIKKYAGKTHFMEYDDACQEYSIALIEAINKIQIYDTDGQCLKHIAICIRNRFPSGTKRNIASLSILQQKSDAEITLQLGLSRQYINRIRKEIYRELSALYK